MKREGEDHVITLSGDFDDISYVYVTAKDVAIQDPYAKASTLNSERSVVIDLASTDPKGWERDERPDIDVKDAIIYEAHVKDMTYDETSGVRHRENIWAWQNRHDLQAVQYRLGPPVKTGHHPPTLMPIRTFTPSTNRKTSFTTKTTTGATTPFTTSFPRLYATEPAQPKNRITELKTMIMALHKRHQSCLRRSLQPHHKTEESPLELLVPATTTA